MAVERPTFYQKVIEHGVTSGLGYREHSSTLTGTQKEDEAILGKRNTSAAVQVRLGFMGLDTNQPGVAGNRSQIRDTYRRTSLIAGIHSDRKDMGSISYAIHKVFRPTQTPEQILKEAERRQGASDRRRFNQEWNELRRGA